MSDGVGLLILAVVVCVIAAVAQGLLYWLAYRVVVRDTSESESIGKSKERLAKADKNQTNEV